MTMQDTPNPRAAVGGNLPPIATPLVTPAFDKLDKRKGEVIVAASAWLTQVKRIQDQETADAAGGFRKQLTALKREADAACKAEQKDYKTAIETIKKRFEGITTAANICLDMIDPLLKVWLDAEDKRIKAEQAEAQRRAAEERRIADAAIAAAEAKIAAADAGQADPAENTVLAIVDAEAKRRAADDAEQDAAKLEGQRPKAGGQYREDGVARSVSLRTVYAFKVADRGKATAWLLTCTDAHAELDALIAKHARWHDIKAREQTASREIPGVTIIEDTKPV